MARPVHLHDIPAQHRLKPAEVAFIDLEAIAHVPGALAAAGALLDVLSIRYPFRVDGKTVTRERSEEEKEKALDDAQADWDRGKEAHDKWADDGTLPSGSWVWSAYLQAEGLDDPITYTVGASA